MKTIDYAIQVATSLQSENKLDEAQIILKNILDANPSQSLALHLSGIIAYQLGKHLEAIQLIEQAIKNNPNNALFYSNLGEMHRQLHNIALSIQHGQQAVLLDPHSAIALANLGLAFFDAKQYDRAEEFHQSALSIHPKLTTSLNNLGSIYQSQGKFEQAIEFYKKAIIASPRFAEPYNNLGALLLQRQDFTKAFEYLKQAITLMPTFAIAYCNLGLALIGLLQYNKAEEHFEKALRLKPNYAEAYYGLAKVYLQREQFIDAEKFIHNATLINPKKTEFYPLFAEIYCEQNKHTKALKYLDHAISLDENTSNLFLQKGKILMEMGEISCAEEAFIKVTQNQDPDAQLLAYYSLVQLQKIKPNNTYLKALLSIKNSDKQEFLYFALGKCFDDLGESSKAFDYFTKGCKIKRERITFNINEQIHFTHQLIQHFSKERIEYFRTFANPSKLPIFIVGMPRSGTTLVEQIISSHSDVYGGGELKYFSNLIHSSIQKLSDVANEYLSILRCFSANTQHITDKMPQNFMAIGLIHAIFPNAKIIHVKRNPIDTCLSCYTKLFSQGHFYSYDLTELAQYYLCYQQIMDHWYHILPASTFLDIEYESIVNNLEIEARKLISYCDLPWNPTCLQFYESKRNVRTASFMQVRQPIYLSSNNRWRRYEKELAPLLKILNYEEIQSVAQQQT